MVLRADREVERAGASNSPGSSCAVYQNGGWLLGTERGLVARRVRVPVRAGVRSVGGMWICSSLRIISCECRRHCKGHHRCHNQSGSKNQKHPSHYLFTSFPFFSLPKRKPGLPKGPSLDPSQVAGCTNGSVRPRYPYLQDEVLSLYRYVAKFV